MEKEKINDLISIRNILCTMIICLTGGISGIIVTKNFNLLTVSLILIPSVILDLMFILNVANINRLINKYIKAIK